MYLACTLGFKHFVGNKEFEQEVYLKKMLAAISQKIVKRLMLIKTVLMILAS